MSRNIPGNDHRNFNNPPMWAALFDIALPTETFHYTVVNDVITVDGIRYTPFPMYLEEITEDGKGEVANIKLIVSNIGGVLSDQIKRSNQVEGSQITFKIYSYAQEAIIYEESLEIIKVGPISRENISFELGTFNPYLVRLLQEKFLRDFCWNRYKAKGCWILKSDGTYMQPAGFTTGSPDTCIRRYSDCVRHLNINRFNSFPGIPGGGGFV
jgi:phage-related protein